MDYSASNLKMLFASNYIPKKDKLKPLGEDAHFIAEAEQTIGIADGVGGWASMGIDAGKYARKLMCNASVSARNQNKMNGFVNPYTVLWETFLRTKEQGSSTACIITLRGKHLHCASVGDSKFVVIRDGKVVFGSRVQQKYFNCPFQLGTNGDDPSVADVYTYKVKKGDIIVAGTDGLFDNVEEWQLERIVEWGRRWNVTVEHLASEIAKFAREQSEDLAASTPFQKEASYAGLDHCGGKYDDITVIVASVYSDKAGILHRTELNLEKDFRLGLGEGKAPLGFGDRAAEIFSPIKLLYNSLSYLILGL